jgi:hypothetical protein
MGAENAPESLDGQVFGCRRIARDAENPAINGALMPMKESFEGSRIALLKLGQDAALTVLHPSFPLLSILTRPDKKRLHNCIGLGTLSSAPVSI